MGIEDIIKTFSLEPLPEEREVFFSPLLSVP